MLHQLQSVSGPEQDLSSNTGTCECKPQPRLAVGMQLVLHPSPRFAVSQSCCLVCAGAWEGRGVTCIVAVCCGDTNESASSGEEYSLGGDMIPASRSPSSSESPGQCTCYVLATSYTGVSVHVIRQCQASPADQLCMCR